MQIWVFLTKIGNDGNPFAKIAKTIVAKRSSKWINTLVDYVIGDKPLSHLKKVFQQSVATNMLTRNFFKKNGFFFFTKECDRVMCEGPWLFDGIL